MTINIGKRQLIYFGCLIVLIGILFFAYGEYSKHRYEKVAEEMKVNSLVLSGFCEKILNDYSDNLSKAIDYKQVLNQKGEYVYCYNFSDAISWRHQFYINNGTFSILDSISIEMKNEMKIMKHTPSKFEEVQKCFDDIYNKTNELYELCKSPKGTISEFNSTVNEAILSVNTKIKETDLTIPDVDIKVAERVPILIRNAANKALASKLELMKKDSTYIAGKSFLAANKKNPGIITTRSGLQYKIIKKGIGIYPNDNSKVMIDYKGTLITGEEFDNSYKRKESAILVVGQNIKGFSEGLKLMPVGSEFIFYIPQELAYGEQGAGIIQPYSTLIFDVKLLKIEK